MRLDGHIRMALHVFKFELKKEEAEENKEKTFFVEEFPIEFEMKNAFSNLSNVCRIFRCTFTSFDCSPLRSSDKCMFLWF